MKAFFAKVWAWIVAHKVVSIVIASVLVVGIALAIILPITLHQHKYEDGWSHSYLNHWHNASCHKNAQGDKAPHDFETIDKKDATCLEAGSYKEKCKVCGYTTEAKVIKATGHKADEGKVTKEATCTEEGVKTYTCTVEGCGAVTKTETIARAKHTYSSECDVKCNGLGCNETREGKAEHTWNDGEVTTEPTCKDEGVKTFTCTVCSDTKTEAVEKLTTHTWDEGTVTTEPTCGEKGESKFTCTVCGETKTEAVDKLTTHTWNDGEVTTEPTCKDEGVKTFTCTVCGEEETKPVDKLTTHTWNEGAVTTEPTCKDEGVNTFTCTVCGETKTEAVEKLAHVYADDCQDTTCENCEENTREAQEHVYADDCQDTTCDNCAVTRTAQEHIFTETTQNAPVYKEDGVYNIKKCANCAETAEVKDDNFIVATTQAAAQAALDGDINGKTLVLLGDADFGTLYVRIREDVDNSYDDGIWAGSGNYTYKRVFEGVTIIGASETAKADVEAIVFEAAQYTPDSNQHSNSATSPYLTAYIEIKNFKVQNLSFTGERTAINLNNRISVEGLTVDHCNMTGNADGVKFINRSGKQTVANDANGTYIMTVGLMKDITVNQCFVENVYQVVELRGTENVTITENTFKNIADRVLLFSRDGVAYTGTITITGNTVDTFGGRFVRFAGQGYTDVEGENVYATIVVSNNKLSNFENNESDKTVIKITGTDKPENVICENNTLVISEEESKTLQVIKADDEDKAYATINEIFVFVQDATNVLQDPSVNE